MIVRSRLKTGTAPALAAGLLLFALAGASLGCIYAACYGVPGAPEPRVGDLKATALTATPLIAAPPVQPMAGVAESGRCASTASARSRRATCRVADLPAV